MRAYVGLGANLGDREGTIRKAVELLAAQPGIDVVAVSTLRETEPVGYLDQPAFLNGAVALETELSPQELLRRLLTVEAALGRVRGDGPRFGPRAIDLDLLLYGGEVVDEPGLIRPASPPGRAPFRPRAAARAGSRLVASGRPRGVGTARLAVTMMPMSNLDELDEYEAELELRLKKEYSAVFSLFRYCIVTQDSTYLCNRHELKVLPQTTYPFFHLTMEDVWVWDKNRPTRIIPRAEVYTSSDVTIEELRGEGDGPALTPEALAQKLGETLGGEEESL